MNISQATAILETRRTNMKNCTAKIVIISMIMLGNAKSTPAQEKSDTAISGAEYEKLRQVRPLCLTTPASHFPNRTPKLTPDAQPEELLKSWFGFNAQTMKLQWM